MSDYNAETIEVLNKINNTLNKIFICFEDKYNHVLQKKREEKIKYVAGIITEKRKKIYKLILDHPELSQSEISKKVGVSQPAVSTFINLLIHNFRLS